MSSAREFNKRDSMPWVQHGAHRGMIKNAPADDLPDGAVSYIRNARSYPTEWQPRLATRIWTSLKPPELTGRINYSAYKENDRIKSLSGNIFTENDLTNYWVWPGDPDFHDEIQEYISPTEVRVDNTVSRETTDGCWMHAKPNLFKYHETEGKVIFQYGTDVYVADSVNINSLTKALCVSQTQLNNSISDWAEMDEFGVIFNSAGQFLLSFKNDPPRIFKKNTNVPADIVPSPSDIRESLKQHRYDYVYAMSRLTGVGIRDRTTSGVEILQESGTTALNPNTSPPRDYGIRWLTKRIDSGIKTCGRLKCGLMAAANCLPTYWHTLTGATSAVFRIEMNSRTEEFVIDFGPDAQNPQNMDDVAEIIQATLRPVFPFATCEYVAYQNTGRGYMVFTTGEEDGSTMNYGSAGTAAGYTDISTVINITLAEGAELNNLYEYAQPSQIGTFKVPKQPADPDAAEWHWTHYTKYRTVASGYYDLQPRVGENGEILPPSKFYWCGDYRVNGAFYACKDDTGLVTALVGEFEEADAGTPLAWEYGDIDTIYSFIDSTHVMTRSINSEPVDYYDEGLACQAAVIGSTRVIRASQAGNIVTILGGSTLTSADERKTLHWATGYYSIITSVISSTLCFVDDSIDKEMQGVAIDAESRVINDTTPDENLRDREDELHIGLLGHRFWTAMPNANIGCVVPGFMLIAIRNNSQIWYCQLGTTLKYKSGYYLPNRQKIDRIEGNIRGIWKMPNKFVVFCTNSTWGGPTNQPDIKTLPEFGESYATLHIDIIDGAIGVTDVGSIQFVDEGLLEMRCTNGEWRQFNAWGYIRELGDMSVDPDTGQDKVKRDLKEAQALSASIFGENIGHIIWY